MALTHQQCIDIKTILFDSLKKKFQTYKPEPSSMPYHIIHMNLNHTLGGRCAEC